MFCLKIFTINFGGEEEGDGQKSVQSLTSLRLCLCMWSTGTLLQFCLIWSLNKEVTVCKDPFWIRVYHHSFHWRIPKSRINNLNGSLEGLYLYIFQNNIKKMLERRPRKIKSIDYEKHRRNCECCPVQVNLWLSVTKPWSFSICQE